MQQEREGVILSAQVSSEDRDELLRRAAEADRSLSAQIRRAVREQLEREPEREETS